MRMSVDRTYYSDVHYSDLIISTMASQITSVSIVYSTACSGTGHRKYQSSASLAFVREIHTWWRHQMETFSALLAICMGNSPASGEFPTQRPVTRSFGVFFDVWLNKRLRKQSRGWWFETFSRPLWRHRNEIWEEEQNSSTHWYFLIQYILIKNGDWLVKLIT